MTPRNLQSPEIEITEENLGEGAKRYKVRHKPTGEYYFVCWDPFEPYGKLGATTYEQGTLKLSRWRKLQQRIAANPPDVEGA